MNQAGTPGPEEGYDYYQSVTPEVIYNILEQIPHRQYPIHEELCRVFPQCGGSQEIRQLLDAKMWLFNNSSIIYNPKFTFDHAAEKGMVLAMKILLKYEGLEIMPAIATVRDFHLDAFDGAARKGQLEVLQWLISLRKPENGGWKINPSAENYLAYRLAEEKGHADVVAYLESIGAAPEQ